MTAAIASTIWAGSQLAEFVRRLDAVLPRYLSARKLKALRCGIGPEADALNASPPTVVFVDGDGTEERYEEPVYQPEHGPAYLVTRQSLQVVIRGENVGQAELLREAVLAAIYDAYSLNAARPVSGRRYGGNQSEQGFRIDVRLDVGWDLLRELWTSTELTGVDAAGELTGPDGADPAQITTAVTP